MLKYNKEEGQLVNLAINDPESPYYPLRDVGGNAIGVCACDVDGDGREEIYFLNTNQAYSGMATYSDKLFKFRNGGLKTCPSVSAFIYDKLGFCFSFFLFLH